MYQAPVSPRGLCPVMSGGGCRYACLGDGCSWYQGQDDSGRCIIPIIAEALQAISKSAGQMDPPRVP